MSVIAMSRMNWLVMTSTDTGSLVVSWLNIVTELLLVVPYLSPVSAVTSKGESTMASSGGRADPVPLGGGSSCAKPRAASWAARAAAEQCFMMFFMGGSDWGRAGAGQDRFGIRPTTACRAAWRWWPFIRVGRERQRLPLYCAKG